MALENEQFMLFTTFRRDGRAVSTPVWLVHHDNGTLAFSTGAESGKVKRLRHTPRVTVQACDRRGARTHGPVYEGSAQVVSGAELERIRAEVQAKYGLMSRVIGLVEAVASRLGSRRAASGRAGIVVTLNDA